MKKKSYKNYKKINNVMKKIDISDNKLSRQPKCFGVWRNTIEVIETNQNSRKTKDPVSSDEEQETVER